MFISEIFEKTPDGYSSEKDDNSVLSLSDLRKTRLTLHQINKLRVINDVQKLEHEKKISTVSRQYKAPAADAGI